jgi:3-phenylpropionate/trans-cinnamate dioxygenase ferredoxin reductase component
MSEPLVIIGAGLTAAKAVEALRAAGSADPVVLYGDERHLPYERPPLSKGNLTGDATLADATVHDQGWYDDHDVELRLGEPVTDLDPGKGVIVCGRTEQPYQRLLIATGAAPRHLAPADESGAPVAYLRTIEDSDRIKEALARGASLTIVGGGWIGLEIAAAARQADCPVTVLETLDLPLLRVLGPEVAQQFADLHRKHGVDLRTGVRIDAFTRSGDRAVVRLSDGAAVESDLVLVGIGVAPNTGLAEQAGLQTDNGILVDEHLRTANEAVLAAGDVANAYRPRFAQRVRVEHWDNAIEQGKVAGLNLAGGQVSYDRLPFFFSDQYDLGMEYVGYVGPEGYDQVIVRGQPEEGTFSAFWLLEGQVLAGMHANDWNAIDPIRQIVTSGRVGPDLADESISLAEIAATVPGATAV